MEIVFLCAKIIPSDDESQDMNEAESLDFDELSKNEQEDVSKELKRIAYEYIQFCHEENQSVFIQPDATDRLRQKVDGSSFQIIKESIAFSIPFNNQDEVLIEGIREDIWKGVNIEVCDGFFSCPLGVEIGGKQVFFWF
jgi:hypothetical protein